MDEYSHDLEKNLEALEMEVHALNAMRNDLLKRVEKEEDRGLQVLSEVKEWVSMVEEIEPKAIRLLDKSISQLQKLSKYDDISQIPPPTQHYSKTVCMMLKGVETHKSKGVFKELVERAPLSHLKKMKPLQKIASREMLLDKVWKCLAENESRTLGFYGMAGVGKTTLLTQVKNKFIEVGDVSSLVIFVVLKSEEVEVLQDKIRVKLGLYGGQRSKEEKAYEIFKFLSRKRFVLLLDDMQRKMDLAEIGVPLPGRENGCKIVFTTDSQEACGSQWIDVVEEVKCLSTEESWNLFHDTVGETTLKSHPDIPQLARIVARKCGGLPIALNLIGRTMSHKRTIREWHRAIHVLVSSIPEFSDRKEVSVLKFTYDNLSDDNMKICFLYCALFPRNSDLSKQDLVDCWIGEGIIDEEDREIAEIKGYEMVGDLVRMGLLTEKESGYGVKMHDMILEMALWVAAQASDSGWFEEHFVVKWGERIHQMPMVNDWNMVRRMSVTSTQIETISGSPPCSKLRTLFLQGNDNLKQISGDFFQWMTSLAVLNLSYNRELSELPEEVSSLVSLQFLNLSWTWINRLPLGLKELKRLIHLDLDYTSNLKEIEVIASLLNLQVLRLFWSVPINLGLMEDIQRLMSLKELSLTVVEKSVFVRILSSHRLRSCIRRLRLKYTTITGEVIALLNAMVSVRELDIFGCNIRESTIDWRSTIQRETVLSGNAQMIPQFWNLRTVCLYECNGLRDLTWLVAATSLDDLTLCKCPHTERVISKEKAKAQLGHTTVQPFQNLTRLCLKDLPKLESIYWTPLPFPVLEDIIISRCPKLKRLPFNSESAIGNQLRLYLDEEWIKGVEWEDEATKQRFSNFNKRDFSRMDGLTLDWYSIKKKLYFGMMEDGDSSTASSIWGTDSISGTMYTDSVSTSDERIGSEIDIFGRQVPSFVTSPSYEKIPASPFGVPPRYAMSPRPSRMGPLNLTMNHIASATNNFSDGSQIGEGRFWIVYKGILDSGQEVAVKRAKKEHFEILRTEFKSKVDSLSQFDHRNLVKLLGYVDKNNEVVIITEFVRNGTLRDHLDGARGSMLNFSQRLEIVIDVCHGLTYLHSYAERQIIHGGVKSSNILLTDSMRAKVGGFGFARGDPGDSNQAYFLTKGTVDYLDPEYMRTYQLTPESDVYSFGILLVEMLTGRRPVEVKRHIDERIMIRWAFDKYNEGKVVELVDPKMREGVDEKILRKMFSLAFQCAAPTRKDRPDMEAVGKQLWAIRSSYIKLK